MTHDFSAPSEIKVKPVPFNKEQSAWLEQAYAHVDENRMRQLNLAITSIHSPTGEEREVSEHMANHLKSLGIDAFYQPVDENSGNAIGRIAGNENGPSLLVYAPIDTHMTTDPEEELPWAGPELRDDMVPNGYIDSQGNVIGLGASNPKGMVTAVAMAAEAIKRAGIPLKGDLIIGFAGGGMPTSPPKHSYQMNAGLGSGVLYMITHGVTADYGIICKPGWAVFWEEVGLCWFKVTVKGTMGYAGIPRGVPGYRSSIVPAAKVILALEEWLPEYARLNTSGQCAPQGHVSAVRAGWPHRPSFPSAATEIYLDIRCNPRSSPAEVRAQFANIMVKIGKEIPELEVEWEMVAAYPGASTNPDNWIIQSSIRAWESVEGKPHEFSRPVSGQTDASAIRNLGIPTARIGYPFPAPGTPAEWEGLGGMGLSYIPDLAKLTKALIYSIIDTCT
jgi:acetylornithine deacetylase/succinyl-diaminopimelate desuccinylase-like protein